MSTKAMGWAYDVRVGDPVRKAVLLAIANASNEEGVCWPRLSRIAWMAEISERTARRALRELEEAGLVKCEKQFRADGTQASNLYRLPDGAKQAIPPDNSGPDNVTAYPVTGDRGTRTAVSGHEQSLEQEEKQGDCALVSENPNPKTTTKKHRASADASPPVVLPSCVPADLWAEFVADRKERKKPMTARAQVLALAKLERMHAEGHDVRSLIEKSIECGWQSFYPPKDDAPPRQEQSIFAKAASEWNL